MGVDWQMTTTISIEDVHWEVKYGKHYWGIRIWSNSMMLLRMKTMSMLSWSTYISYSELTFHTNMIKFHEWIAACFLCHCKISKLFWFFFFKYLLLSDYVKMENYWTRFYQGIKGEGLLLLPLILHIFLVAF
jgi:hypothetical protein